MQQAETTVKYEITRPRAEMIRPMDGLYVCSPALFSPSQSTLFAFMNTTKHPRAVVAKIAATASNVSTLMHSAKHSTLSRTLTSKERRDHRAKLAIAQRDCERQNSKECCHDTRRAGSVEESLVLVFHVAFFKAI